MSKKYFIALADALRAEKPADNWLNKKVQWDMDVRAICRVLAASNPRFNELRWMQYVNGQCGPNGGAIK